MRAPLRAGIAIFNAGEYHAAHDAWEDEWLGLATGSPDERFLHGLIQYTAAIYHVHRENAPGAAGLAESALEYLDGLGPSYHGVDLEPIRKVLEQVGTDPLAVDLASLPPLTHDCQIVRYDSLQPEATRIAAKVLAEEWDDVDEAVIFDAIAWHEATADRRIEQFVSAFLTAGVDRQIVLDRLRRYIERERASHDDVRGLFGDQSS